MVQLLDVQLLAGKPTLLVVADDSQTEECDMFVQRLEQAIDPNAKGPDGSPITMGNRPSVLRPASGVPFLHAPQGTLLVSGYCFLTV